MPERKRAVIQLRKLMFVLPNLFTVTSIFCGFYAVSLCAGEPLPTHLYQAALAIFFAMFFDAFDGRVARLTKTQSQFGVELDSLADVMSFGLAPGLLMYKWALAPLGFVGIFVSFSFAACGALRLARFNVLAQQPHGGGGSSKFFVGLPIPLAAGVLISLVIAHHAARGGTLDEQLRVPVAIAVTSLALLMVSTVSYRTFKDIRFSPKSAGIFLIIVGAGVLIATQMHPAYVLVAYCLAYLVAGLAESAVALFQKARDAREGAEDADADDEDIDEQEFL